MARYIVQARYGSRRDGQQYGPWAKGTEVDLSEADAAWVNRDCPGVLVAVVEKEPEAPTPEPVLTESEPAAQVEPVEPEPDSAEEVADEAKTAKRPTRRATSSSRDATAPVDF